MTTTWRFALLGILALGTGGCGLFGDEDELKPAELINFEPSLKVQRLWSAKLGGSAEFLRLALAPVGDGVRIYAASRDGNVSAFEPATGKRLWRTEFAVDLSAGPGVGNGLVVVAAADGFAIALDAATGAERWRAEIGGESLARPAVSEDVVIVQTVDNRLHALEAYDGSARWQILQSMPRLTVRGNASPVIVGTNVVAGFDNGRLVAADLEAGTIEWETLLAPPTGRSDLERLSDIDGAISVVGQDIYAAGYQGRVAAVAAESGQILWAVEVSSFEGVAADWTSLYTVLEDGVIVSVSRRNGAENWRQAALLRRKPTLPVPFDRTVVSGDFEGYLHFFGNVDGKPVARVKQGGAAISSDPVVVADRLYVQNDAGVLTAYSVVRPERPGRAPDIADEGE